MGTNGSTGNEAVASAEKNAALLTTRAGARDPSAIPSICRISAALQYPAGESLFFPKGRNRVVNPSPKYLDGQISRCFLVKLLFTAS